MIYVVIFVCGIALGWLCGPVRSPYAVSKKFDTLVMQRIARFDAIAYGPLEALEKEVRMRSDENRMAQKSKTGMADSWQVSP